MLRRIARRFLSSDEFPRTVVANADELVAVFETTNPVEHYRASELGGEREFLQQFLERVDSETRVWDVGANIGVFSLFAARAGAVVHSFEPDPGFAARLRRNRTLNGQEAALTVHEYALSDRDGTVTLYTDGVDGKSPRLSQTSEEERSQVTVEQYPGVAIDVEYPDVLKIDVEGAEGRVIEGFGDKLRSIETIVVEIHPEMLPQFGDSVEAVRRALEGHGFAVVWEQRRDEQIHVIYER